VVDITHINASAQARSVQETLVDIDAGDIPIITAFNKIDRLKDPESAIAALDEFPNTYPISAKTGQGIEELLEAIERELFESYLELDVRIPFSEGQLISMFHESGQVIEVTHGENGAHIKGLIPRRLLFNFEPYLTSQNETDETESVEF
jgi:GTP-binding protein HflX